MKLGERSGFFWNFLDLLSRDRREPIRVPHITWCNRPVNPPKSPSFGSDAEEIWFVVEVTEEENTENYRNKDEKVAVGINLER